MKITLSNNLKYLVLIAVAVSSFSFSANAQEAKKSCAELMNEFDHYDGTISEEMKTQLNVCRSYCSVIANYASAREFCGLDDCKYMVADGKPSAWCCEIASNWQNKIGAKTNPLAPVMDMCGKQKLYKANFVDCANKMRNGAAPSDECCLVLWDVKKFDPIMGYDLSQHCQRNNIPTH